MTKKQIEKRAKEMANKYPEFGYNSRYHREIYAAAMEMAEWILFNQWVRVEDELPPAISKCDPISDRVLVYTSFDCVFVDHYDHYYDEWLTAKKDNNNVTHWMPIPPLAEEGGEK